MPSISVGPRIFTSAFEEYKCVPSIVYCVPATAYPSLHSYKMTESKLVWLITGTSTGIGRFLSLAALERGDSVIATTRARSMPQLADLETRGANILQLDVTDTFDNLKEIAKKAVEIHGRVDVLVNNAGISETLNEEIAHLGLRSINVELGYFNTEVIPNATQCILSLPAGHAFADRDPGFHGYEPGDPAKGADAIVDIVRGEGFAKGREIPPTIGLGANYYRDVKMVCEATLKRLVEWESLIPNTDFTVN
ncbi:3-oxoacyl-[acyl-carrier-protein] reductase FabG [Grifola frondosa]|uniref:3-oxoacyl-[acyl-carrier-protein] reductase FabG n=1 Tax=Grifola frondosa TaxID=5627 RepID=A0A1C7LKK9_GRIFR|nr:3-oxoacyl-[acyl-carrier-protein] reductase FabG [Grifola frondosa]